MWVHQFGRSSQSAKVIVTRKKHIGRELRYRQKNCWLPVLLLQHLRGLSQCWEGLKHGCDASDMMGETTASLHANPYWITESYSNSCDVRFTQFRASTTSNNLRMWAHQFGRSSQSVKVIVTRKTHVGGELRYRQKNCWLPALLLQQLRSLSQCWEGLKHGSDQECHRKEKRFNSLSIL